MDPRFYTPRQCGSVSSRSQHSQNSDASTTNSYTTARDSLSVRSFNSHGSSVYRTPRSSPFPSNRRHRSHDRRKDLRRFSDHGTHQHRQPSNQYYNDEYDNSQPIQIQSTEARRQRDYDRIEQQQQQEESRPPPNILSLARHGRSTELQAMLNHGTPIDTSDDNGNTILHIGCQNGHKKIVKLAIQYGGGINAVNDSGNTGLHYSMKYGKTKISEYLISKGADTNVRNQEGRRCTDV